jgi:Uma2 family endonuclease
MGALPKLPRMRADEFVAWAMDRPRGERYELVPGEVVAMSPERAVHARVRHAVCNAPAAAIAAAGLRCEAFPNRMTVRIDENTVYEPDALVRRGPELLFKSAH